MPNLVLVLERQLARSEGAAEHQLPVRVLRLEVGQPSLLPTGELAEQAAVQFSICGRLKKCHGAIKPRKAVRHT